MLSCYLLNLRLLFQVCLLACLPFFCLLISERAPTILFCFNRIHIKYAHFRPCALEDVHTYIQASGTVSAPKCRDKKEIIEDNSVVIMHNEFVTTMVKFLYCFFQCKSSTICGCLCLCLAEPPENAVIRAMGIHYSPEHIGDNLVCCAKHLDVNKKKGNRGGANLASSHTHVISFVISTLQVCWFNLVYYCSHKTRRVKRQLSPANC